MNNSLELIHLKKNEHFCQIRATLEIDNLGDIPSEIAPKQTVDVPSSSTLLSCDVSLDPIASYQMSGKINFEHFTKSFTRFLNRKMVVTMMPVRKYVHVSTLVPLFLQLVNFMRQITVIQICKCYKKNLMNWSGREYLPIQRM